MLFGSGKNIKMHEFRARPSDGQKRNIFSIPFYYLIT
jgi:hypothetical protein